MTIGSVFYFNADNLRHVEQSYYEVETVGNEKMDQNFVEKFVPVHIEQSLYELSL